ncbi:hypothetical protein ABS71_15355 [bacterium SCN 62-11]|nr:hypothetical protein [Candidatus Eremiobacteraeota bacterium]ODT62699.1 MAG: hypothetical protein ABS71_15355 [bacterium SCN 62-11]
MKTALLLLLLAGPLWAQTFESQAAQATQLMQQHKLEKGNGVKTPWSERDKASLAGDAWLQAAQLATTDAQRFQAYESAGLAYTDSQTLADDALKAFRLARDVTGASGEERARAGIQAANRARTRAEWELVLAVAGATPQQRAKAWDEVGKSYIVESKKAPELNLKIVEGYEKAAEQMAQYDPRAADTELGIASVVAQSIPQKATAVAAIDRIHKTLLALPLNPEQKALRNAMIELRWGDGLLKVGANERATGLWLAVGKNTAYPADQREEAYLKAADAWKAQSKVDQSLAALAAAAPLRGDNFVYRAKIADKQLELMEAHKRYADELKVVQALAKHPKLPADRKETLIVEQARLLYKLARKKEAEALLLPLWTQPPRGGDSIYSVAVTRAQAAIDGKDLVRARLEIEAGLARLREMRAPTQQLEYISARLYVAEKKYTKALEAYAACCTTNVGVQPSAQLFQEVRNLFQQTLQEKRLEDARAIVQAVAGWRVEAIYQALMTAQLAVATGDAAGGNAALARCREELKRFYGSAKEGVEKEITAVEAALKRL